MSEMTHPLKAYRTERDIGLSDLARRIGTSRQSLFRIEKGEQSPSLDLISRITEATNGEVTANALVAARKASVREKT